MNFSLILDQLRERLAGLGLQLLDFLPNLIAALFVLLVGWALAWIMRVFISRVGTSLVNRAARFDFMSHGLDRGVGAAIPRVLGAITFWVLLLVFAAIAVDQLGIDVITDLFARLTQYLPAVVLASLIVFAGVAIGNGARAGVESAASSAGLGNAATLGRFVQVGVVTASALVAADQLGIESTLLIVVFAITVGTSLGGVALAFGIGSGPMVSNIIASHNLRKTYRVGQLIRIGSAEGRILEIGPTSISMDTVDGTVQVPASRFAEEVSVSLREK